MVMNEPKEHDAPERPAAGISHDGQHSVTFRQDEAMVINDDESTRLSSRAASLPARTIAGFVDRSAQWPRSLSERSRNLHMSSLCQEHKQSMLQLFPPSAAGAAAEAAAIENDKEAMEMHSAFVQHLKEFLESRKHNDDVDNKFNLPELEIRLQNVNYQVPSMDDGSGTNQIQTIYNTSLLYKIEKCIKWLRRSRKKNRPPKKYLVTNVLSNINLQFKPKCMYLVLGPPLSGKTSLLKAIAGILPQGSFPSGYSEKKKFLTGQILFNNLVCAGDGADTSHSTLFKNLVAFIRQSDFHAPRLTVAETLLFSGRCKDKALRMNKKGTSMEGKVGLTLEGLGLSHVQDTFVGNEQIRGVSGGQRRRVTLGEMLVFDTPLLCCDEISTGLDTASTVDILRILSFISRIFSRITVVSLLQPSPEAVALFDEVILLGDGGHVIFAGPTERACDYFRDMGFVQPPAMDDADFLLAVASPDRKRLYDGMYSSEHHSSEALSSSFNQSKEGMKIIQLQQEKWARDWSLAEKEGDTQDLDLFMKRYQNSFWVSLRLNVQRSFTLWRRDTVFIRASIAKNVAMGVTVGLVFLNTDLNSSFFGVLFQGNLFLMLGAMTSSTDKLDDRKIFYKHDDSNFSPALSYIFGQALALIPQMVLDVLLFGSFIYWMVGFVATAKGFILYLALFFSFNFTMGQLFGLLTTIAPSKSVVQAGGSFILFLNVLFCGYIVSPTAIPDYYIWIYWMIPLPWVYRALLLNEFADDEEILATYGFLYKGEPFTSEWIGYCFAYLVAFLVICMGLSAACLHFLRVESKRTKPPCMVEAEDENEKALSSSDATFIPVNLSFTNLCYEVKQSTGSEQLKLLSNVSGIFSAGRMCALMGESGAGKTTLMDVIALRKGSGNISGTVLLNGFPQEPISFRRCSGYVEQFDVQSAELTVRETILFSAQLRLDRTNPVFDTPEGLFEHVGSIIRDLELTREADILVGSEDDGGLTFEQKKRLSIAVELAASPSIVFLDEPTSGLDARAALLVMATLKKMCSTGRTVVATIHQPSSAVFDMFDDLLLLKKGGEMVFYGDLGESSGNLISYFENLGATCMNKGENPSTWMLNVLGETIIVTGEDGENLTLDFGKAWVESPNCLDLQRRLLEISESQDEDLRIKYESEFAATWYRRDNLMANRIVTIYWRSTAYNLSRMALSLLIAFFLGSVYIPIRSATILSEAEITSMLSTIFISFIMIGVLSITAVLPVMQSIRDMYYRHKAAGMLNSRSVARSLATAEKKFIILSSLLFCAVFIPTSGIANNPNQSLKERCLMGIVFWAFFAFNSAIYSYCGQLFMCLVRGIGTAQVLASIFIGICNFFSGLIVRPQQMTGFWQITYWINPGHFVYEGLCMSVFSNDSRIVMVGNGSQYYAPLDCDNHLVNGICEVEASTYVDAFFGGLFSSDHIPRNLIILGGILVVVRASTFLALRFLTYSSK